MDIDKFILEGKIFIEKERQVEKDEYETIYNDQNFQDLEAIGFAISNFEVVKVKNAYFQKKIVCFSKINNQLFSSKLRIKVSDNVVIAEKSKTNDKSPVHFLYGGIVHKVTSQKISILFENENKIEMETRFSPSTLILKSADNVTYDRFFYKYSKHVQKFIFVQKRELS